MSPLLGFAIWLLVLVLEQSAHLLLHCFLLGRVIQIFILLYHLLQIQLSSKLVSAG